MDIYQLGENKYDTTLVGEKFHTEYEDYSLQNCGSFVFQQRTTTNMDKLWRMFHEKQDYPELYMGVVEKMARCKCPITGKDEWHNIKLFSDMNPSNGDHVTLKKFVKNKLYNLDRIFIKWEKETFYEWKMTSGNILQLKQEYIDGLLPKDKRYLKMST
jgi:hypothetical protein